MLEREARIRRKASEIAGFAWSMLFLASMMTIAQSQHFGMSRHFSGTWRSVLDFWALSGSASIRSYFAAQCAGSADT